MRILYVGPEEINNIFYLFLEEGHELVEERDFVSALLRLEDDNQFDIVVSYAHISSDDSEDINERLKDGSLANTDDIIPITALAAELKKYNIPLFVIWCGCCELILTVIALLDCPVISMCFLPSILTGYIHDIVGGKIAGFQMLRNR